MRHLPNAPKSPAQFWGIVLGIPVTFIVIIIFIFMYQGSTKDITKVANQFEPGAGWTLESERVVPPRIVCLSDASCPSIHKIWSTKRDVSKDEFAHMLAQSKWSFPIIETCIPPVNVSGTKGSVCHAEGRIKNYETTIWLSKSTSSPDETDVVLTIN